MERATLIQKLKELEHRAAVPFSLQQDPRMNEREHEEWAQQQPLPFQVWEAGVPRWELD